MQDLAIAGMLEKILSSWLEFVVLGQHGKVMCPEDSFHLLEILALGIVESLRGQAGEPTQLVVRLWI
jgi:hypothetical protein